MNSVIEQEGCKIGTELCRAKPDWKTLSVLPLSCSSFIAETVCQSLLNIAFAFDTTWNTK